MKIGAHMSIAGGIDLSIIRAAEAGFNCLQLFTSSPRTWAAPKVSSETINKFIENRKQHKIKSVVVHAPYLPNLASPDQDLWEKSLKIIADDLIVADAIEADFYVMHPGSHKGEGTEFGISRISAALTEIFSKFSPKNLKTLKFLLETTAGSGFSVGGKFEELALIIKEVKNNIPEINIGVCLDTAHIFAAGYDFQTLEKANELIGNLVQIFGENPVAVIHANDSKVPFGSKKDRHNHIGKGEIGILGFSYLLKDPHFRKIPWILETPKDTPESDIQNRDALLSLY